MTRPNLVAFGNPTPPYSPRQQLQSNAALVAQILNASLWASLAREEARPVTSGIAIASLDDSIEASPFAGSLPFNHRNIVQLGTVAGLQQRIGVHEQNGSLAIWGLVSTLKPYCQTVWFDRPGRVRVSFEENQLVGLFESGRLSLAAKLFNRPWNSLPQIARLLVANFSSDFIPKIALVANEASRLGHGATILAVPNGSNHWEGDLNISFRLPDSSKASTGDGFAPPGAVLDARIAKRIAAFTRLDGAVVVTADLNVIGFGARILTADLEPPVPVKSRCVFESDVSELSWSDLGGTRHQSAARFVAHQPGTAAFVSSSDGGLTLFTSEGDGDDRHVERLTGLEIYIPPG